MASKKLKLSPKASLPFKTANKHKRQDLFAKQKKARESSRRDERMKRRREEDKNPRLREERLRHNLPLTIERKRVWDEVDSDAKDILGVSVDVERFKRQKLERDAAAREAPSSPEDGSQDEDDRDSMIDSATDTEEDGNEATSQGQSSRDTATEKAPDPSQTTSSTNLSLMPDALAAKFPSLVPQDPPVMPKILITTSLSSTLHEEGHLLTTLFPNSVYIPRSAHRYAHKFSIREISSFAANRKFTAVVVLMEDQKKPSGLDFVVLPHGPMFHFSISNWVESKKIPGHGRPTNHYPELILNNFKTPLGLLVANLFRTLFPPQPEFLGRQVVTLHVQRDFIFCRRHRYIFRNKRDSEKAVVDADGKAIPGSEGIRTGLQELGPRFTMVSCSCSFSKSTLSPMVRALNILVQKLRRIDKGIQRSSGQEWEWKGKTDRIRTKFQL